jgi:phosphatidylglycerophosphatase C
MQRLQWHCARGDRVAVVSGGWDLYLQPWCESQGLELLALADPRFYRWHPMC